jgi:hypothetical protein
MFGLVVLAAVVLGGGYIAFTEINKTTGQKVKDGDGVFVPVEKLSTGVAADDLALKAFLGGLVSVVAKVTNVTVDAVKGLGHGNLIGFPATVSFPLESVASIDRNGTRIV